MRPAFSFGGSPIAAAIKDRDLRRRQLMNPPLAPMHKGAMSALAKGLLALCLVMGGVGCGIKKPPTAGSSHPGVNDDGGVGGNGVGGEGAGEGSGGEGAGGEGAGGFAGTAAAGGDGSGGAFGSAGAGGLFGVGGGGAGGTRSTGGSGASGGTIGIGGKTASGGAGGIGGKTTSGGASGIGGKTASGGASGIGGKTASGGGMGSGGANASGGAIGTGGVSASGGAIGSGGVSASGGAIGTGGVSASGGVFGTGGTTSGTGGVSATGGATLAAGTCIAPIEIPTDVPQTDLTLNTSGHAHAVDLPCATTGGGVVLAFILTQRELVYADTFGASWNTVLAFGDYCEGAAGVIGAAGTTACSDDGCGTLQSQAVALLGYGRHYLFVAGAQNQTGPVTVHFQHAPVGSGPLALLAAGTGTATGTTSGTGAVSLCEASAAENSYWWNTCPTYAGGTLTASTCTGTAFDTVVSLQIPRAGTLNCADDDPTCGVKSKMSALIPGGAGLHVLTVDGGTGSAKGAYTLTYKRP
jgi:hypothetical protein